MSQERISKTDQRQDTEAPRPRDKAAEGQAIKTKAADAAAEIDAALGEAEAAKTSRDALMDEIDAVLEVDAESFVRNFVQRGGE